MRVVNGRIVLGSGDHIRGWEGHDEKIKRANRRLRKIQDKSRKENRLKDWGRN